MRFLDPTLQTAIEAWRCETGAARAEADNIWFEERVGAARQRFFEDAATGASDADGLRRQHIDYWKTWVTVSEDTPHTFLAALEPADLGSQLLDECQPIIRLEALNRPFGKWSLSFTELEKALKHHDIPVLQGFLNVWNESSIRDHRPAFAAWKD
ncbi:MAG: hypothetical protein ACJ8AI_35125, partial [Rhodopila sp.]